MTKEEDLIALLAWARVAISRKSADDVPVIAVYRLRGALSADDKASLLQMEKEAESIRLHKKSEKNPLRCVSLLRAFNLRRRPAIVSLIYHAQAKEIPKLCDVEQLERKLPGYSVPAEESTLSPTDQAIAKVIRQRPGITQKELASETHNSLSNIKKRLAPGSPLYRQGFRHSGKGTGYRPPGR